MLLDYYSVTARQSYSEQIRSIKLTCILLGLLRHEKSVDIFCRVRYKTVVAVVAVVPPPPSWQEPHHLHHGVLGGTQPHRHQMIAPALTPSPQVRDQLIMGPVCRSKRLKLLQMHHIMCVFTICLNMILVTYKRDSS